MMPEASNTPDELPPGAIHLGTFNLAGKGPGTFAGGVVKLWNDPDQDLLHNADGFLKAADRCLNGCKVEPGIEMLTVPGTVCAALACELYLKYAHFKEFGKYSRGHDLLDLFNGLSEPVRAHFQAVRPDIEQVLERNRSHFEGARYHHETAQVSFRQQELLQLAEQLSTCIRQKYKSSPT